MVQILDVFIAFLLRDVEIVFKYIFNSSLKKLYKTALLSLDTLKYHNL